ncbi:MAG TPA: hypothetical protein VK815_14055 [Candidatus Acidoferrales bacterium]|jgi:hypothetical protein|nr:hypothetical protein [Candidatus Acidoferrales bacterium]
MSKNSCRFAGGAYAADVFLRLGKVLVIAALVLTTGAHWIALQTVAWTTMLAANWSSSSFSEAVSTTFDGRHPCPLCKAIAAGKKSEQKKEFTCAMAKLEFPPVTENIIIIAPKSFSSVSAEDCFGEAFFSKPPVPPPRSRPV